MTQAVRLSRRSGELLLCILEQSKPVIAATMLDEISSELPADLIKIGALKSHGVRRTVIAPCDDGPTFRDLDWEADRAAYGYFDTFDGCVAVAPESQTLYRVDLPWWLEWLASSLALTNSSQPTELVAALAWDIGDLWITRQRNIPVLFVRRLHRDVTSKALRDALQKRAGRSGGLILTSGRDSMSKDAMERFAIVPIANVLTNDAQVFSIDRELLLSPFLAAGTAQAPTQPLHLSPDGRRLTINGDVTLDFKSKIHIELIRRLVDGHKDDKRWRAQELLEHAGSGVTTLARAFGKTKWKRIEPYLTSQNGLWGFNL